VTALFEIADLHVRFGIPVGFLGSLGIGRRQAIEAVAGVSLAIEEGETVAIVGESGSGKTTLARAAAGLVHAQAGSVKFRGQELTGLGEAAFRPYRRDIAMMFQDPIGSLSPRLTVKSLITEPFKIQKMTDRDLDAESARLLGLVGLPAEFGARYPYQLSGGQARRVGVARALALEPKLILADEPTAGLDVSVQGEVLNLLGDLRDRLGLAIMIITHNLNVVRHVADRMAIMYLGRFVEVGPTEEIFFHPRHPYTLALLAANPEPDPDARIDRIELKGEVPSLLNRPSGCEFHTRCPFVQERCRGEAPAVTQDAPGHLLTCHFPRHREQPAA
jgi:peptide/nickel transport system ATP-binding protein